MLAYLEPGVGSLILQALAGGIAGLAVIGTNRHPANAQIERGAPRTRVGYQCRDTARGSVVASVTR